MRAGDRVAAGKSRNVVSRQNDGSHTTGSRAVRNIFVDDVAITACIRARDGSRSRVHSKRYDDAVSYRYAGDRDSNGDTCAGAVALISRDVFDKGDLGLSFGCKEDRKDDQEMKKMAMYVSGNRPSERKFSRSASTTAPRHWRLHRAAAFDAEI